MERHDPTKNDGVKTNMSVRMYPDVNILLTLDFEQPHLLRKCTIFKDSIQHSNITCYQLSTVKTIRNLITQEVVEAGGNALRGLWNHLSMAKGGGVPHILEKSSYNRSRPARHTILFPTENISPAERAV